MTSWERRGYYCILSLAYVARAEGEARGGARLVPGPIGPGSRVQTEVRALLDPEVQLDPILSLYPGVQEVQEVPEGVRLRGSRSPLRLRESLTGPQGPGSRALLDPGVQGPGPP